MCSFGTFYCCILGAKRFEVLFTEAKPSDWEINDVKLR